MSNEMAELYGFETRALKQAVNRNKKRLPVDFMFVLSSQEIDLLVLQSVIPSKKYFGGASLYAFTEQGVANLSSILTSDMTIEVNIKIIRAFVDMRRFISRNAEIFTRLDRVERKQLKFQADIEKNFEEVFNAIESKDLKPEKGIF